MSATQDHDRNGHRIQSVTKRVTGAALVLAAAAVVVTAVYGGIYGAVMPLRGAAAFAVIAGAVAFFGLDRRLVAERRAFQAERSVLARERTTLVATLLRSRNGVPVDSGHREPILRPVHEAGGEPAEQATHESEMGVAEEPAAQAAKEPVALWERFGASGSGEDREPVGAATAERRGA